jgi:hypothetical protein
MVAEALEAIAMGIYVTVASSASATGSPNVILPTPTELRSNELWGARRRTNLYPKLSS